MKKQFEKVRPALRIIGGQILFPLLLVLWPFMGLHRGVDVADTTYALTNYTWLGEMDPMWLLATWLPNVLGRLFTTLPGGDTLYGMKVYCTLLVPVTALIVYVALGRIAGDRFPAWLRFLGLWIAESLCWCQGKVERCPFFQMQHMLLQGIERNAESADKLKWMLTRGLLFKRTFAVFHRIELIVNG